MTPSSVRLTPKRRKRHSRFWIQLSADATSLFLKLDGIKGESQDHKHKGEIELESLSSDFLKIEGLALKAELISVRKAGKGQQEFLKIEAKIEDVFQKATDAIQKLDDPASAMLLRRAASSRTASTTCWAA